MGACGTACMQALHARARVANAYAGQRGGWPAWARDAKHSRHRCWWRIRRRTSRLHRRPRVGCASSCLGAGRPAGCRRCLCRTACHPCPEHSTATQHGQRVTVHARPTRSRGAQPGLWRPTPSPGCPRARRAPALQARTHLAAALVRGAAPRQAAATTTVPVTGPFAPTTAASCSR